MKVVVTDLLFYAEVCVAMYKCVRVIYMCGIFLSRIVKLCGGRRRNSVMVRGVYTTIVGSIPSVPS